MLFIHFVTTFSYFLFLLLLSFHSLFLLLSFICSPFILLSFFLPSFLSFFLFFSSSSFFFFSNFICKERETISSYFLHKAMKNSVLLWNFWRYKSFNLISISKLYLHSIVILSVFWSFHIYLTTLVFRIGIQLIHPLLWKSDNGNKNNWKCTWYQKKTWGSCPRGNATSIAWVACYKEIRHWEQK